MKTPNALPPNVLPLGERFKNASIMASVAPRITHIDSITIGDTCTDKAEIKKHGYPYHLVDINATDETGRDTILVRSKELHINRKELRKFMRQTTRRVATFIFESKRSSQAY